MIIALILIFLCALFLTWQGTLSLTSGFILMASSLAGIVWKQVRSVQSTLRIRREIRDRKAKWGGSLFAVSGIPNMIGRPLFLFITRRDELVIEDPSISRIIPLEKVKHIALFYGSALKKQNDAQLGAAMELDVTPRLAPVRAFFARHPQTARRLYLAIEFVNPLGSPDYSEMAFFADMNDAGNLRAFALRPEIAVKTTVVARRRRRRALTSERIKRPTRRNRPARSTASSERGSMPPRKPRRISREAQETEPFVVPKYLGESRGKDR